MGIYLTTEDTEDTEVFYLFLFILCALCVPVSYTHLRAHET